MYTRLPINHNVYSLQYDFVHQLFALSKTQPSLCGSLRSASALFA